MRTDAEKQFVFHPALFTILEKDAALVVIGTPEQLAGLKVKLSK